MIIDKSVHTKPKMTNHIIPAKQNNKRYDNLVILKRKRKLSTEMRPGT